jgi:transcription termination factor NusB
MVTELVSGTTRWRRRLDYTLAALLKGHSVASLDAPVRNALRLALYELVELQSEWWAVRVVMPRVAA